MRSENLSNALKTLIWSEIDNNLHTCIPGIVQKYEIIDGSPIAEVQPAVKITYPDGVELAYQPIVNVPVVFPRSKQFKMSFPLEKGDGVLLLFAERAIGSFIESSTLSSPDHNLKFDTTDAIAIPGLFGYGSGISINDKSMFEIEIGSNRITSDGVTLSMTDGIAEFKMENGKVALGTNIVEVLDILSKTIDAISRITTATALGTQPIINLAEFVALKLQIDSITGKIN